MEISNFDDLVQAARLQKEPQKLLFVFTKTELPEDCTPEQRCAFEAGTGGALIPLICLDKAPEELGEFNGLLEESHQFLPEWAVVFTAALSGKNGIPPTPEQVEAALNSMVEAIKAGAADAFIPFDAHGQALLFGPS
mgnify:CR=1 FL=1